MEVYLPPDESELFKYVCLDQKVLFQIMKGVQAFISEQPLPLQLPPCHFVFKALSPSRSFPAPVPLPGVSSLLLLTGSEGNEPLHHRPGASLLKLVEIFSSIGFAKCLITYTRLPLFKGIRSSFGVSPFGIPSETGMTGMFPLFLCFWSAQFLHDLVLQNWGLPIQGI